MIFSGCVVGDIAKNNTKEGVKKMERDGITAATARKRVKADPKKAAKIVGEFVVKDKRSPRFSLLGAPYHDKKNGVVVATDGRIMIVTRHGYDPNAKEPENRYPNWREVVPDYSTGTHQRVVMGYDGRGNPQLVEQYIPVTTLDVDPSWLSEIARAVMRLGRDIGRKDDVIYVRLPLEGGEYACFDAKYIDTFARAMAANGMTEMKATRMSAILAKNDDTTIVLMPVRFYDMSEEGRGDGHKLTIDGITGRILSAPERDDTGEYSREVADALRKTIAEREQLDKTPMDAKETQSYRKKVSRIEKRIAAEDEIDALMSGGASEMA